MNNNSLLIILFNANGLKNLINEIQNAHYDYVLISLITKNHFTKYSCISILDNSLLKSNHLDGTVHDGVAKLI